MRAVVQRRYGPPSVLDVEQVTTPEPGPGEVLVRVAASSVNARDWHVMRGEPLVARLDRTWFGVRGPRTSIRGTDFAGTIVAVGPSAEQRCAGFRVGDRVFGEARGCFAEYVVAAESRIAPLPEGVGFEAAAAVPLAAATAWACLADVAAATGRRLLVNGASGGVGTFVLQLARRRGFDVTAVCSSRNADLARELGADTVVDYRRQDFTDTEARYDVVIDLVGNRRLDHLRRIVGPGGAIVLSGGGVAGSGKVIGPLNLLARAQVASRTTGLRVVIPQGAPNRDLLEHLIGLVTAGALTPVISKVFPLEEAAAAIDHLETEHARAKVVLNHAHSDGGARGDHGRQREHLSPPPSPSAGACAHRACRTG